MTPNITASAYLFTLAACLTACGCDRPTTSTNPTSAAKPALPQQVAVSTHATPGEISSSKAEAQPRAPSQQDWFEDVTSRSGVNFAYDHGRSGDHFTVLETIGGGVGLFDYDVDGDFDLYFPGGGTITGSPAKVSGLPSALFRNDGDFKFVDVTKEVGLAGPIDYSHGCAIADYDSDGFPDLLVTCYGRSRLYHNESGKAFRDVTEESELIVDSWSTAAAWFDYDADGQLDVYVGGYLDWKLDPQEICMHPQHKRRDICIPQRYPPSRERLFRNAGNGTFSDISHEADLADISITLGAVAADFNRDGRTDIYVANDVMQNYLYRNTGENKLQEIGSVSGTAFNEYGAPEGSMGIDTADYDGDGDLDLFVTNYEMEDNSLYRNEGNDYFSHVTLQTGLAGLCKPMVGFGTGFADFDSDGWLDLLVINGHVMYSTGISPYEQPSFVFRNQAGRFEDVSQRAAPYFTVPHVGRGAACGDLDNDGAVDLVIVHQSQPATILRNRLKPQHWLRVQLRGTKSNRDAVGATCTLERGDQKLLRVVRGGGGYMSHFDSRLLFPLTSGDAVAVTVAWPSGIQERFANLAANQVHELVEGSGEAASN